MLYVWLGVLIAAVIIEAMTSEFVAIWFFPAALVCMILSLFELPEWVQMLAFFIIGLALLFATRPLCRKLLKPGNAKTNVDAVIGKACIVTEEIRNIDEVGEVKLGGLCWSARSEDGRIIPVGEQVTVLAVQGVKLIVK